MTGPSTSVAIACAILLGTAAAHGMDLQEAFQSALLQDATTRAARAALQVGEERINQATAQLYPNVSISAGYLRNNLDRNQPDFPGQESTVNDRYPSKNTTLTVRQPLYRKAIAVLIQQARAQRDDAQAGLQKETQNLAVRVTDAYTQILLARDQLGFIEAQKIATTTQLDAARKQFTGGNGTRTDIDEAQARLDMALAQELEARQQQGFAERQLALLINSPVDLVALHPLEVVRLTTWSPLGGSMAGPSRGAQPRIAPAPGPPRIRAAGREESPSRAFANAGRRGPVEPERQRERYLTGNALSQPHHWCAA